MGGVSGLLGGGGGGTSSVSTLTGKQKKISKELFKLLKGKMGLPAEAYGGDLIAPLQGPLAGLSESLMGQSANQFDQATSAMIQSALSGVPGYQISPEDTASLFEKGVARPMRESFQQNIRPQINEAFASGGATFSSRKGDALSQALSNMQTSLGAGLATTQMDVNKINAELWNTAQGRGMEMARWADPLSRAMQLTGAMQPLQNYAQAQAQAQYQDWERQRGYNSPWTQMGFQYLGEPMKAITTGGSTGGLGGILGTLMGLPQTQSLMGGGLASLLGGGGAGATGAGAAGGGMALESIFSMLPMLML